MVNCKIDDDVVSQSAPTQETPTPSNKATAPKKASTGLIFECDFCDQAFDTAAAKGGHTSRMHPNMGKTA